MGMMFVCLFVCVWVDCCCVRGRLIVVGNGMGGREWDRGDGMASGECLLMLRDHNMRRWGGGGGRLVKNDWFEACFVFGFDGAC